MCNDATLLMSAIPGCLWRKSACEMAEAGWLSQQPIRERERKATANHSARSSELQCQCETDHRFHFQFTFRSSPGLFWCLRTCGDWASKLPINCKPVAIIEIPGILDIFPLRRQNASRFYERCSEPCWSYLLALVSASGRTFSERRRQVPPQCVSFYTDASNLISYSLQGIRLEEFARTLFMKKPEC